MQSKMFQYIGFLLQGFLMFIFSHSSHLLQPFSTCMVLTRIVIVAVID